MSLPLKNRATLTTGEKTVTTAGTAEQLHSDLTVPDGFHVTVIAKDTNAGRIYYGGSKTEAEARTANLDVEDSEDFWVQNLNQIWLDPANGGEGVNFKVER